MEESFLLQLNSLGDDSLVKIFSFLEARHLCQVLALNWRFHKVASDEFLWKQLLETDFKVDTRGKSFFDKSDRKQHSIDILILSIGNCNTKF
jgi:hypothetical protein